MRSVEFSLGIAVAMALGSAAVAADNIGLCDFNKSNGTCEAVVRYDEASSSYTIPATGACQTVTVLVGQTQYPHKMKDQDRTDSVMQFDNSNAVEVSISGCTSHPTKLEVIAKCRESYDEQSIFDCQAPIRKIAKACLLATTTQAEVDRCINTANPQLRECRSNYVDSLNACVGGKAFSDETPVGGKMKIVATENY